jgi:hypothetical protein
MRFSAPDLRNCKKVVASVRKPILGLAALLYRSSGAIAMQLLPTGRQALRGYQFCERG